MNNKNNGKAVDVSIEDRLKDFVTSEISSVRKQQRASLLKAEQGKIEAARAEGALMAYTAVNQALGLGIDFSKIVE